MNDDELEKKVLVALACAKHGLQEWKKHCACKACGRIYADAKLAWDTGGVQVKNGAIVKVTPPDTIRDTACECGGATFMQICKWCFIQLERDNARVPVPTHSDDEGN